MCGDGTCNHTSENCTTCFDDCGPCGKSFFTKILFSKENRFFVTTDKFTEKLDKMLGKTQTWMESLFNRDSL